MLHQLSTAADLIQVLDDPARWLTGVLTNFVSYDFDPQTSAIRIGIKGHGIAPNYKIEKPSRPFVLEVGGLKFETTETPAHTFNGREAKALLAKLSQSRSIH